MSLSLKPILRNATAPSAVFISSATYICSSCRNARVLRRPKRPYTFSQLVTLSDGSAFMMRTTSPLPVYRSTRDTKNAPLWNPNSKELLNVEEDEAGRLAGFRARFGRAFDSGKPTTPVEEDNKPTKEKVKVGQVSKDTFELEEDAFAEEEDANMLDLISSYGQQNRQEGGHKSGKKK